MSDETIFSRIAAGEAPSYTVYEDGTTYAFLDVDPVSPGHTLVVPRDPYQRLQELPPGVATDLTATLHTLVPEVESAVGADATSVILSNGEAAGQEVPHVHWHIVPQFENEAEVVEYHSVLAEDLDESEMESIAAAIRSE